MSEPVLRLCISGEEYRVEYRGISRREAYASVKKKWNTKTRFSIEHDKHDIWILRKLSQKAKKCHYFCNSKMIVYTFSMWFFARILLLILGIGWFFVSLSSLSAQDYIVPQIPSGYTLGSDGWYIQPGWPDRYRLSSSTPVTITPWVELGSDSTSDNTNILGIDSERLRNGDIGLRDIPIMIVNIIEWLLMLVGAICVVALIYHAVRMQFYSGITGDTTWVDKAKKWMKGAVLGFILAMSAWFLMTKLVSILASAGG